MTEEPSGTVVGIFMWIVGGVGAAFAFLLRALWGKHNNENDNIHDLIETQRVESKDNVRLLHDKIEETDRRAQDRHLAVLALIRETIK
jgi:hypothetical protein